MSNWEPGDLALRVWPVDPDRAPLGIRQGGVYTVTQVLTDGAGATGLRFAGIDHTKSLARLKAFSAKGFIKITPGADVTGIEEPRRVPVPAREKQDA